MAAHFSYSDKKKRRALIYNNSFLSKENEKNEREKIKERDTRESTHDAASQPVSLPAGAMKY